MPTFLMEPDLVPPFVNWKKAPTPANTDAFLKAVQPIVDSGLRAYGSDHPVLRSRARSILVDAMPKYDPRAAKFKTFALTHLQGLRRSSARYDQVIKLPETIGIGASRLDAAGRDLEDELGRPASDQELADRLRVPLKQLNRIRGVKSPMPEGALWSRLDDEDGPSSPAVLGGNDEDTRAWHNFVYQSLGPVDQVILENTSGLNGRPKLQGKEIALMLGVSPAAVSQRRRKIQEMLDRRFETGVF